MHNFVFYFDAFRPNKRPSSGDVRFLLTEVAVIILVCGAVRRPAVCCFVAMFVASSYNMLCSYDVCFGTNCTSFAVSCMRRFSEQFPVGHAFNNLIVVTNEPYSCWLSKICFPYADVWLLVVKYLLCVELYRFVLHKISCTCGISFRKFHNFLIDY